MASFVVEATRSFPDPIERVFARLADGREWHERMPLAFRPLRVPQRLLAVGDRIRVLVAGAPATIRIVELEPPRAIVWTGGVRRVLFAEHRFDLEEDENGGTRVRSHETWSGVLATRLLIAPLASRIGRAQLAALAAFP
jgi:hypothetical protein